MRWSTCVVTCCTQMWWTTRPAPSCVPTKGSHFLHPDVVSYMAYHLVVNHTVHSAPRCGHFLHPDVGDHIVGLCCTQMWSLLHPDVVQTHSAAPRCAPRGNAVKILVYTWSKSTLCGKYSRILRPGSRYTCLAMSIQGPNWPKSALLTLCAPQM